MLDPVAVQAALAQLISFRNEKWANGDEYLAHLPGTLVNSIEAQRPYYLVLIRESIFTSLVPNRAYICR
jgi:hypothetical protein